MESPKRKQMVVSADILVPLDVARDDFERELRLLLEEYYPEGEVQVRTIEGGFRK